MRDWAILIYILFGVQLGLALKELQRRHAASGKWRAWDVWWYGVWPALLVAGVAWWW
jgi:hypothetical protein